MTNCIEVGHNYQVIKNILVNENKVKQEIECVECSESFTEYVDITEVAIAKISAQSLAQAHRKLVDQLYGAWN